VIEASVPVRICDLGGWTDTWFGGPGRVLNVAVRPGVRVCLRPTVGPNPVLLDVDDPAGAYPVVPGAPRRPRHPLLEVAIDALPPPQDCGVEISVRSAVPPGCSAGTSASVAVALLAALAAVRSERWSARELAYAAHRLEVDVLGQQSGIQDQLSAASGGIKYLEIDRYPEAEVRTLPAWDALSSRLTLVYVGRAHDSSGIHEEVIQHLEHEPSKAFARLRDAAVAGRDAVLAQDLHAFGDAMIANTDAQQALHADLVGPDARRVIELAAGHGAVGWKVNGAGGAGGSVTVLSPAPAAKALLEARMVGFDPRYRVLPIEISPVGVEVTGAR
jgi:D-glycero-alpha-D-manno-heptose-7-phosphate kinase